jgi:hypothetical protein
MQHDNNIMVLLHRSVTSEICKELKDRFYQGDIFRNSEASWLLYFHFLLYCIELEYKTKQH